MTGLYRVCFTTKNTRDEFVERFSVCPLLPVIAPIHATNDVFIVCKEVVEQHHGSFEQASNTLVISPELLGAKEIHFIRDDRLITLIGDIAIEYGTEEKNPCGSQCEGCPSLKHPCMGCIANRRYFKEIQHGCLRDKRQEF